MGNAEAQGERSFNPSDPVFHGEMELPTRDSKLTKDNQPPAFGRLNATMMAQPNTLAGPPPGVETAWIKGTQTAHVTENRITIVDQKENHTVFGTQDETVHDQATLTYLHGRDVVVGDEDKLNVNGSQEVFVLGESEETYVGHHELSVPWEFEFKLYEAGLTLLETKGNLVCVELRLSEIVITFQDIECGVVKAQEHVAYDKWSGQDGAAAGLSDLIAFALDMAPLINLGLELGPGHIP